MRARQSSVGAGEEAATLAAAGDHIDRLASQLGGAALERALKSDYIHRLSVRECYLGEDSHCAAGSAARDRRAHSVVSSPPTQSG